MKKFRRTSLRVLILTAVAVVLATAAQHAHALGGHDGTPEQDYIDYAANNPELQSTGWMFLFADDGDTTPDSFASSVFLDDGGAAGTHWVLTAGHALDEGILGPMYDQFAVGTGSNTGTDPGEFQFADEVFFHPGYAGAEAGVDLALLYFETPFLTAQQATIYTGNVQVDDVLSITGFGPYGTPTGGLVPTSNGQRRGGEVLVDRIDYPALGYIDSFFASPLEPEFLPLGVQVLPGDSGGGWYIDANGDLQLAGITSGGTTDSFYGSASSAYLVANHIDWINETIASKIVPEPSSILLTLLGSLCLTTRRRRSY